jgi:integrase
MTFKQAAEQCIADRRANWRNAKHAAQWNSTLATYAYPILGSIPVGDVDKAMVIKVLRPIWYTKHETADRVRSRIETVLNWAAVNGAREGENAARWKGHLEYTFAERAKTRAKHHAAMHYRDLPAFMAELRERNSISARALEFTILTAARTNETIGAVDHEINGEIWMIPPSRMKTEKEHKVPLCGRALEIIETRARVKNNVHLFSSARATKALSNMAMLELLRGLRPGFTVHGFRSTFRDWAAECTNFQNHVVEAALAHAIPSAVEAAYRRGDLFEKRRELMEAWGAYCASPTASAKVIRMHSAA